MHNTFKNTLVAFLIVLVMAPGFYMGVAPVKKAEAQLGMGNIMQSIVEGVVVASACKYGSIIGDLLGAAIDSIVSWIQELAQDIFGAFLGAVGGFLGSIPFIGGFLENLWGNVFGLVEHEDPVPVTEQNPKLLSDIGELNVKECILDGLVWIAKRILIDSITNSIMEWIHEGFYGGPIFVRDPGDWARLISYKAIRQFIVESGVEDYVCSPFREELMRSVARATIRPTYGTYGSASCNLDEVGDEIGYITMVEEGVLLEGGIATAMALTNEGNNAFSAYFNLLEETRKRQEAVVESEKKILDYGDGMHSPRCNAYGVYGICTPGQFVAKQIDDWAGGSLGQLEVADEVSEIIDALFAHMVEEVFYDSEMGLLRGAPEVQQFEGTDTTAAQETAGSAGYEIVTGENGVRYAVHSDGTVVRVSADGTFVDPKTGVRVSAGSTTYNSGSGDDNTVQLTNGSGAIVTGVSTDGVQYREIVGEWPDGSPQYGPVQTVDISDVTDTISGGWDSLTESVQEFGDFIGDVFGDDDEEEENNVGGETGTETGTGGGYNDPDGGVTGL